MVCIIIVADVFVFAELNLSERNYTFNVQHAAYRWHSYLHSVPLLYFMVQSHKPCLIIA